MIKEHIGAAKIAKDGMKLVRSVEKADVLNVEKGSGKPISLELVAYNHGGEEIN